jgi:hypothetical protein
MLRTAAEIVSALRSRKEALGLSNAVVEEIAGLTIGHWDKACGPTSVKSPNLYTLTALAGALGLAVVLVEDPDAKVRRRWQRRQESMAPRKRRIGRLRRLKSEAIQELARHAGKARWAGTDPDSLRQHMSELAKRRWAMRAGSHQAA